MTRRLAISIALIGVLAAAAYGAPASPTPAPRRARAAAPAPAPSAPRTAATPRRLDEIHIEGEIPVPQVLFITAREQRRFVDFRHRRYLRTSRKVGEETVFPSWIATVGNASPASGKESHP